ncbi:MULTISPECIES: GNAT family N-acetyltransferase [unclassified Pseudomonas]|uniref:GNAT family N-acetyltransferase n=1 Tax=unclassified Pseudomonas TaxID=196821 RepID=UPI002AC99AFB|nr:MULTISPECIES: GNAT family N-acetyltransferase [unclassified Pseudomonas]MEB0043348.1 GNAT family N-acetyltransferase [Pseudomonas sp. MH10]MEB0122932.1 GNAT family N-acetyltransferase [Pseudomonas sp. CCI1.2]WPX64048.1 GNAT family N-acetyltransferase [Pseudomonas sp. MH10]
MSASTPRAFPAPTPVAHVPLIIKIVESEEERLKAMLVRAIVYMHEQQCPFNEEFDLNDHTATQVVGLLAGEPVLTARIRYFNGFAKIERLAIRAEYRRRGHAHQLLSFLLDICRQKGFSRFYLHAQIHLESFYAGYGFRSAGSQFSFSEHGYVEMVLEEDASFPQPSRHIGYHPMALNRPENSLHTAGPLEQRASATLQQLIAQGAVA